MRNITLTLVIAFLISIFLHYITFVSVNKTIKNKKLYFPTSDKKSNNKKGYTSIKYVKLLKPKKEEPKKEKKPLKKPIKEIEPKKKIEAEKILKTEKVKKVVKKEIKKVQKKKAVRVNKPTKNIKEVKTIKLPVKKEPNLKNLFTMDEQQIKLQKERERVQRELLEEQMERKQVKELDPLTQEYIKLYGEQFFAFSKEQKKYIRNNISTIGKITQRYLEYPRISIRTRQSGVNIVEFYLHPNGDITDLKLVDSSGYTALDGNSVETIRIAYKDYPKPIEPVKIRIYIKYLLY